MNYPPPQKITEVINSGFAVKTYRYVPENRHATVEIKFELSDKFLMGILANFAVLTAGAIAYRLLKQRGLENKLENLFP